MTATIHSEPVPDDIREQTLALWGSNRLRCGWFVQDNYTPKTQDELFQCLTMLAKHGDRATFILARKLIKRLQS
jgi:hypothetical protein